jgi:hypothetical protein
MGREFRRASLLPLSRCVNIKIKRIEKMGNLQVNENKEWGCRTQSFERAVENA